MPSTPSLPCARRQGCINLLPRVLRLAVKVNHQRDIFGWHPHSRPVQAAGTSNTSPTADAAPVEVGTRERAPARAPQILMRVIQNILITCIGMNGGHETSLNTDCLMQDFGHRRQTICGTGRIGNNLMLCGQLVIHAIDDR